MLGALSSVSGVVLGMIRSKLVAETLGSVGVGIVAEVTQVLALLSVAATVANGPALLKWIAEAARDRDVAKLERGLGTAITLAAAISALAGAICVAFAPRFLPGDWQIDVRSALALTAVSVGVSAVAACVTTVHVGLADIRAVTLSQVIGGALSTVALVVLVLAFGLDGQFAALAVGGVLSLLVTWWLLKARVDLPVRVRPAWDPEFVKLAFTLGTGTIVSGYVLQLLLTIIRVALEGAGVGTDGADYNGNFQAAYAIGTTYFSAVLSGIGTYYFPRFAAARDAGELTREVHSAADFVLGYTPVLAFLAIAFRSVVIRVLYSDHFTLAADILGFLLAADIAKAVGWSYGGPLPMRGHVRAFVLSEGFALLLGGACVVLAVRWLGPLGVGVGMFFLSVAYLPVVATITRLSCGIEVRWSQIGRATAMAVAACVFNVALTRWSWLRWVALPVLSLWAWRAGHLARLRGLVIRVRSRLLGALCRGSD